MFFFCFYFLKSNTWTKYFNPKDKEEITKKNTKQSLIIYDIKFKTAFVNRINNYKKKVVI